MISGTPVTVIRPAIGVPSAVSDGDSAASQGRPFWMFDVARRKLSCRRYRCSPRSGPACRCRTSPAAGAAEHAAVRRVALLLPTCKVIGPAGGVGQGQVIGPRGTQ